MPKNHKIKFSLIKFIHKLLIIDIEKQIKKREKNRKGECKTKKKMNDSKKKKQTSH